MPSNTVSGMHKHYKLHPQEKPKGMAVTVGCLRCKWESLPVAAADAEIEGSRLVGLDGFCRGWLAGAFNNHDCQPK